MHVNASEGVRRHASIRVNTHTREGSSNTPGPPFPQGSVPTGSREP